MRILPGPTKSNQVLAWSPDGRWLVAGGTGDGATVWDVNAGTPGRRILGAAHGGRLMRFCPRTGWLYVAFQSGGFWRYDPVTGDEWRAPWSTGYGETFGLAVSDDGREVAVSNYRDHGRRVTSYAVADDGSMTEAWVRPGNHWNGALTFRPGTHELFGLGRHIDGALRFEWAAPDGDDIIGSVPVPVRSGVVAHWALSPDGSRVAWLTDHALYLRGLDPDVETLELPAVDGTHRRGLAWSPDGRLLSYTTGTTVRLLDPDTLAEVRALDWNIGKPRAVAFNPDGLRAAVSGDGGRGWVTVFDLE